MPLNVNTILAEMEEEDTETNQVVHPSSGVTSLLQAPPAVSQKWAESLMAT